MTRSALKIYLNDFFDLVQRDIPANEYYKLNHVSDEDFGKLTDLVTDWLQENGIMVSPS
jgi:hypothetical protein